MFSLLHPLLPSQQLRAENEELAQKLEVLEGLELDRQSNYRLEQELIVATTRKEMQEHQRALLHKNAKLQSQMERIQLAAETPSSPLTARDADMLATPDAANNGAAEPESAAVLAVERRLRQMDAARQDLEAQLEKLGSKLLLEARTRQQLQTHANEREAKLKQVMQQMLESAVQKLTRDAEAAVEAAVTQVREQMVSHIDLRLNPVGAHARTRPFLDTHVLLG